ncbi:MAG: alpha/beta hydrolase [Clostridia bacterium]|nr:alpha/beta hydrolase [Clostridia bacterium]
MKNRLIYLHGKGGSPDEAEHYKPLFPDFEVIGLNYRAETPWDAKAEIGEAIRAAKKGCDRLILVANSIGAFYAMSAEVDAFTEKAFFISPIVDMERLILDILAWSGLTEKELEEKGKLATAFGEDLYWEYLTYVRSHPLSWRAPTEILYGSADELTRLETVETFAKKIGAKLTVMPGGEHWFHTAEQMEFLDSWIRNAL